MKAVKMGIFIAFSHCSVEDIQEKVMQLKAMSHEYLQRAKMILQSVSTLPDLSASIARNEHKAD